MMLLGACGSDSDTADDTMVSETAVVNTNIEPAEDRTTDLATTEETMQEDQTQRENVSATSSNWNNGSMAGSSVNINRLLNEYPEVNQAIRTTLSDMTTEEDMEYSMQENMVN
ncbi:hypothetical protein [Cesiribacter sp. SM1]|uniref:hypothetical protein n=1 Tax=Cesiribacter sp. SM1 TaxID=2861196 RepID=UPI001CD6C52F|nr:hypothetical protein [Cesiribacter sp. SM1]